MPLRTLTDQDGTHWSIWDVTPQSQQVTGLENGWLCFESPMQKRRLTPVPPGWHDLSDADLCAMIGTARLVQPPARLSAATEGQ
jgi:hypothetical protein